MSLVNITPIMTSDNTSASISYFTRKKNRIR